MAYYTEENQPFAVHSFIGELPAILIFSDNKKNQMQYYNNG